MHAGNTAQSWGWPARLFHWLMAVLILFQLGLGVYMSNVVSDLLRQFVLIQTHKSWGFVIFALALLRLAWRIASPVTPARPEAMPAWQWRVAEVTHRMLYLLMLALPLSGWVMASASPTQDLLSMDNMVFDWFALPDPWVPGIKGVADAALVAHAGLAVLLALLLAGHAGAALKHQFFDRDGVLSRMTFGR
jgi:cytochrome b561